MKLFLTAFFILLFASSLSAQFESFQVERFNKKLDVIISDPGISQHSPVGIIYQDTAGGAFTNLSDRLLRIADNPFGFQIQTLNVFYSELTKNSLSFNQYDTPHDNVFLIGPSQKGFWGPRDNNEPFEYDLNTFGNIFTKDIQSRRLSELTARDGRGALKLYRYPNLFTNACSILTMDDMGDPVWTKSSSVIFIPFLKSGAILKRLKNLDINLNSSEKSTIDYSRSKSINIGDLFPEIRVTLNDGSKAINYMKIGPLALQAVIEQQEIIETLEERIARLEKLILEK